jgi:Na+-transporting NADH:ubiquinone oxidoreductase subunit C
MDLKAQGLKGQAVLDTYNVRIQSLVVDINGDEVTTDEKGNPIVAEEVSILKNYKKPPEERLYPVFKYMNADNPEQVESYILPMYGAGLWDAIWGFVAMDQKFETIVGVSFDHRQETPGLGARISSDEVQGRYNEKKIYSESGELMSVTMLKGEGNSDLSAYQVDGMSGATLTGKGLNEMLKNYFTYYSSYIEDVKGNETTASR